MERKIDLKKILTAILLLFTVFGVVAQDINQVDAKGLKQGIWQKKYPNSSTLEYKGQFKDNKPVGTFTYFYPSNDKKAVIVHGDKGRSVATYYHESGGVMSKGIYRNAKKDSVWLNYNETGLLSTLENFKDGQLDGEKYIYFPGEKDDHGQAIISATIEYKMGKLEGFHTEYFLHNPTLVKAKTPYVSDRKHGTCYSYHPNGKVMFEERYKNGLRHGYSFGYDISGKETGRRYYKNGNELSGVELSNWLKECKAKGINPND